MRAGYLGGGVYEMDTIGENHTPVRMNRFTGEVQIALPVLVPRSESANGAH